MKPFEKNTVRRKIIIARFVLTLVLNKHWYFKLKKEYNKTIKQLYQLYKILIKNEKIDPGDFHKVGEFESFWLVKWLVGSKI